MTEAEFERCIERICQGDKTGLKDIYTEYLPYLYRIVYGIVGNKENAEDITSDFFVKLWSLAPKYRSGNGHKGYLATIARNMAIDHIRKHRSEVLMGNPEQAVYGHGEGSAGYEHDSMQETAAFGSNGSNDPAAGDKDSDDPAVGKNSASGSPNQWKQAAAVDRKPDTPEEQVIADMSIKEALGRLKPEERQIIDMKVLGEMTFKEIAETLGMPMGTVTWRYQEGIKRLRRCGYE